MLNPLALGNTRQLVLIMGVVAPLALLTHRIVRCERRIHLLIRLLGENTVKRLCAAEFGNNP